MKKSAFKYTLLKVKRYLFPILITFLIVTLYHTINIRLFSLDITKQIRLALFHLSRNPRVEESVVLLNIGRLGPKQLETKIDSLLKCYPREIGINLCHYDSSTEAFVKHFHDKKSVVIANCAEGESFSLSRIVNDDNSVTHFRSERNDYFEFKLDLFENRGNEMERIYFIDPHKTFYRWELADVSFIPEYFQGKTVLVGYMGDYLTDSVYYYAYNRITPMNPYFGYEDVQPDMYDTEISATIISAFEGKRFINEVGQLLKVLLLLAFCVFNVVALTFIKTKWNAINIVIASVVFIFLSVASSALVLFVFTKGYYLAIDELPLVLLITTIFTVGLNIFEKKELASKNQ